MNEQEQIETLLIAKRNEINLYPHPKRENSFILWARLLNSWRELYLDEVKEEGREEKIKE